MEINDPKPDPPALEFMTVKQVAKYLNISAATIYGLCITGKISHYRFGEGRGAIRINRMELLEFVQRCRVEEKNGYSVLNVVPRSPKIIQYKLKHLHLDSRPSHECGAMTKAGTSCTNMTREEHCHQHGKK